MIFRHRKSGDLYVVLAHSFSVERQRHSTVYMSLSEGQTFDRDTQAFTENFDLVNACPQGSIKPRPHPSPAPEAETLLALFPDIPVTAGSLDGLTRNELLAIIARQAAERARAKPPAAPAPRYCAAGLNQQHKDVVTAMRGGDEWTLEDLREITGIPAASVSARIRELRAAGYTIARTNRKKGGALYILTGEPGA